ncbi:MAG: hypothetical protein Q9227_004110 [Pyrenula ochraceoflavens]
MDESLLEGNINNFHVLVDNINTVIRSVPGSNASDIDPAQLLDLMAAYKSDIIEWVEYALLDTRVPYTRNLVDECDGKGNLVLKGTLLETLYEMPTRDSAGPLVQRQEKTLQENDVAYISDKVSICEFETATLALTSSSR